jgi:octopine/nopaline transport system permease protein
MSLDIFNQALWVVLSGLKLTLIITVSAFVIGQIFALPIALACVAKSRFLKIPAVTYTFLVRGSPLLVQLFIVYYGLGQIEALRDSFLWPVLRSPLYCAILTIGLNSAAYTAEVVAGTIRQLPTGQWEAASALGLPRSITFLKIILPQVYRAVIPTLGNEAILVMKGSTLASAVTVMEMTGAARVFVARSYAPFETFIVAGILYLILGIIFGRIFRGLERAMSIPSR